MSLWALYLVPALIGLAAAWAARRQKRLAARIGLASLFALPAVVAWCGVVLAAEGAGGVGAALWAAVYATPAWGAGVVVGAFATRFSN